MKLLTILCLTVFALYVLCAGLSVACPEYGVVVEKEQWAGFKGTMGGISMTVFPRWEVTVVNAFHSKTISLSPAEYELVSTGEIYRAKYPLFMYAR